MTKGAGLHLWGKRWYLMVMKYEPFSVVVKVNGSVFRDYGHDNETPQECARRIFFENTGSKVQYMVAISGDRRIPVESVDPIVKSMWPKGAKTIPEYEFTSQIN